MMWLVLSIFFCLIAIKAPDVFRSEVRVQTIPVRQKPPRTSKSKAPSSAASDVGVAPVSLTPTPAVAVASAAGETASLSRIKTSSIVDRHFGHVIRVTHHHHPALHAMRPSRHYSPVSGVATAGGDAFDSLSAVTKLSGVSSVSVDQPQRHVNERPPPSPTESEVRSVVSMDLDQRRHLSGGYISDDLTLPRIYANGHHLGVGSGALTGLKKPKPVPPRKPSFLYLNRATSLQSVDGAVHSLDRHSLGQQQQQQQHQQQQKQQQQEHGDEAWSMAPAPASKSSPSSSSSSHHHSLKSTLASNLKWNILSSSRTRSGGNHHNHQHNNNNIHHHHHHHHKDRDVDY